MPAVVKWSDDFYSPVDVNTMSTVPEHPEYFYVKVSNIYIIQLTDPTSGMNVHDIIIDWTL